MKLLTLNLKASHNKKEFSCGKDLLDQYLKEQAGQDVRRKLLACFVLTEKDEHLIKGYYTLSSNSIPLENVPGSFKRKLPKSYRNIPTILLGRLAVDLKHQGQGIGKILLVDALKRCFLIADSIGSFAVIVDPLDEDAENFYGKYGFIKLPDSGKMFLPMKTVNQLFTK